MNKQEILNELQAIKNYMEEQNAFHGYGQMSDLIVKLEKEQQVLDLVIKNNTFLNKKCTEKGCDKQAVADYNGHGDYACKYHLKKWDKEYELWLNT